MVANGSIGHQPQGANIVAVEWDDELAAIAQRYVDQCIWGHDRNRATSLFTFHKLNFVCIICICYICFNRTIFLGWSEFVHVDEYD